MRCTSAYLCKRHLWGRGVRTGQTCSLQVVVGKKELAFRRLQPLTTVVGRLLP